MFTQLKCETLPITSFETFLSATFVYTLHESMHIIVSVDSISRDGPDTPICVIQYKNCDTSVQLKFGAFYFSCS